MVVAPQALIQCGIRQSDQPVVIGITGDIAPRIIRVDFFNRKNCLRRIEPVAPKKYAAQRPLAGGCDPIAFALFQTDSAATNGAAPSGPIPTSGENRAFLP